MPTLKDFIFSVLLFILKLMKTLRKRKKKRKKIKMKNLQKNPRHLGSLMVNNGRDSMTKFIISFPVRSIWPLMVDIVL